MPTITITGVDERTSLDDIQRLLDLGAEIGILYTETPEGRNRYPSRTRISNVTRLCSGRFALHVCGRAARARVAECSSGLVQDWIQRIQINGPVDAKWWLERLCVTLSGHTIITQWRDGDGVPDVGPNHSILVDGSGGRGILPAKWSRPNTFKPVGFSGGLGPHNLATELPKIAAVGGDDLWVDMETEVRTDNWFDAEKAFEAVKIFNEWKATT